MKFSNHFWILFLFMLQFSFAANTNHEIIARYVIHGSLIESESQLRMESIFDKERPITFLELIRSLDYAAQDPDVKAVVFDIDNASISITQLQEITRRLHAIRNAKKDVWLYSQYLDIRTALLGSAANHFVLMPEADCSMLGIHAESFYYKNLLDKLGVQVNVVHIGNFKSFGEEFYLTSPSDYSKQQTNQLLQSIFSGITLNIANNRRISIQALNQFIDDAEQDTGKAREIGLVDELSYKSAFIKKIENQYPNASWDDAYELSDNQPPKIESFVDILKLLKNSKNEDLENHIAVVPMIGAIDDASIAKVRSEIIQLSSNNKVKGLVLRIDSPGGSALSSEVLWEATKQWKDTGKPFVVSMGDSAASGGYYIASYADRIFAESATITGSIGVVGMKVVYADALAKLGITTHNYQIGKNAAINGNKIYTPEEEKMVRNSMLKTYNTFKKRVQKGRETALKSDLESLAGGRVYSGTDAQQVGLVDEIGGLHEAIQYVATAAKLDSINTRLYPKIKHSLGDFLNDTYDDQVFANTFSSQQASALLHFTSHSTKQNLKTAYKQLKMIKSSNILLLGPSLEIK